MGLLMLMVVWFIADPETNQYFPRSPSDRLYSVIVVIIFSYCISAIFQQFLYLLNKNKKIKTGIEYVIVIIFMILSIASMVLFITYFINHQTFSWSELIRNCGLTVPVFLIFYLFRRSSEITAEYNRQTLQLEKTKSNQLETELKYLRAQYHPHFLFNALNTVYFQIDEKNTNAKNSVEILSELLRYQLYNIEEKVEISEEIYFIKSYISFQQLRMTERLTMITNYDEALDKQKIYPLIYQPFLENAFKYVGGDYFINLELKLLDKQIVFHLKNSLPEDIQQAENSNTGIGIENIKRRLSLLYPERHSLNIKQDKKSFIVELSITPESDEN